MELDEGLINLLCHSLRVRLFIKDVVIMTTDKHIILMFMSYYIA